jgi:RNA polymerase sigma-70 factor (ECF subfamily)
LREFDEKLVTEACRGDKNAYALLVDNYYKQIFLVCLGVVGNIHDAEDIAQETILKGFQEISKLRKSTQFVPWITKIAKNLSINFIRRKQRGRQIIEESTKQPGKEQYPNENLQRAIADLPMEIRLPLVMYYFDGQSVNKVAENLDMSTSAVYSKLREAIKELHKLLAE